MLLNAIGQLPKASFNGTVWRSVRQGRNPLICWKSGGRWDNGKFAVLYTSLAPKTAVKERRFHLDGGQPVKPRTRYELFELSVSLNAVITFPNLNALSNVGMDVTNFGQLSYQEKEAEYPSSQAIGYACTFLDADGILVPSARDVNALNLIIFCDNSNHIEKKIFRNHGVIDFS